MHLTYVCVTYRKKKKQYQDITSHHHRTIYFSRLNACVVDCRIYGIYIFFYLKTGDIYAANQSTRTAQLQVNIKLHEKKHIYIYRYIANDELDVARVKKESTTPHIVQ